MAWTTADVPDQSGRVAVVTGGSGGLGLETARVLSARGADVIVASRNVDTGRTFRFVRLDLASLASVREAAETIRASSPRIDLLINNAGVMTVPFELTADGFERTFATNHLGHFALTGLLLDRLVATPGSRVVTVSSLAHRRAGTDLDGIETGRDYDSGAAYDRSKLANLLFAFELQRRLQAAGAETTSVAAHPGQVRTELWRTSSWFERALLSPALRPLTFWFAQNARDGALPTLRAAVDPAARGGDYYGPSGWFEATGSPVAVEASPSAHDQDAARRLWQLSEQLTGVSY
jgi:protochlorophyllide reductase